MNAVGITADWNTPAPPVAHNVHNIPAAQAAGTFIPASELFPISIELKKKKLAFIRKRQALYAKTGIRRTLKQSKFT